MFTEILTSIEALLEGLLDPATMSIVSDVFDFILSIFGNVA